MNTTSRTARFLGAAFLLQFVTSFSSGAFVSPLWLVSNDLRQTLINVANRPWLLRANILIDMITALGIIFLGVMLFTSLRKQNEPIAMFALGAYILEAALLAVSRMATFSLLDISREFVSTGNPASMLTLGRLAIDSMNYVGSTLHMLVFCTGGLMFYYLLYKSAIVPRLMALWGLVTLIPCLAGTLIAVFGYQPPIYLYLLYVPFELVIGMWILIKGLKDVK